MKPKTIEEHPHYGGGLPVPCVAFLHREEGGQRIALLFKRTKATSFFVALREGYGVSVIKEPNITYDKHGDAWPARYRQAVHSDGAPYSIGIACQSWRGIGEKRGISEAALAALNAAEITDLI